MSRRNITRKTARVAENPVTHELETTVLDTTQLALERIIQCIDGQMLKLSTAE